MPSDLQIDYLLANKKSSWSTSSGVAHAFPHQCQVPRDAVCPFGADTFIPVCLSLAYAPESWKIDEEILMKVRKEDHTTTTKSKFVCGKIYPPVDKINYKAPSCEKIQYVKTFLEYPHRLILPVPTKSSISQYQQEFTGKFCDTSNVPEHNDLRNLKKYSTKKVAATEEPFYSASDGGVSINIDPYATTSRLAHRPFSNYERKGKLYEKAIGGFFDTYDPKKMPATRSNNFPVHWYPVYDSLVFQSKASIRVLPKKTYPVPYRGLLTETQEQYRYY